MYIAAGDSLKYTLENVELSLKPLKCMEYG